MSALLLLSKFVHVVLELKQKCHCTAEFSLDSHIIPKLIIHAQLLIISSRNLIEGQNRFTNEFTYHH